MGNLEQISIPAYPLKNYSKYPKSTINLSTFYKYQISQKLANLRSELAPHFILLFLIIQDISRYFSENGVASSSFASLLAAGALS